MKLRWLLIILGILIAIAIGLLLIIVYQRSYLDSISAITLWGVIMSQIIKYFYSKIKAIGKKRDIIDGWIHEHNEKDLITGFNELFQCFGTPKSKYAVEHLKGYGLYTLWEEYESLKKSECYLNIQKSIEKTVERKIPSEIIKSDIKRDSPPDCYDLYQTVSFVYNTVDNKRNGTPVQGFFEKTLNETRGCFEIINPISGIIALVVHENLANRFMEIVTECINNEEETIAQFKLCDAERQKQKKIRTKLEIELNIIIENFNKHIEIKGSCEQCEGWHKDLEYL